MPNSASQHQRPPVVLTIAGFDPSSGAGVTADLQVFAAHGLFGTAAITALTAQSTVGVTAVEPVRADLLKVTLDRLVADLPPAGIKIGMLGSAEIVRIVAEFLRTLSDIDVRTKIPVVLDPVLRSSSGTPLLTEDALALLIDQLIPLVSWITPNFAELWQLTGIGTSKISELLHVFGERNDELQIISTGGDEAGPPTDYWRAPDGTIQQFRGNRIATTSTHGTGCAFSSALLSHLVNGRTAEEAIRRAKAYVEGALQRAPGLGHGAGPLDLLWPILNC